MYGSGAGSAAGQPSDAGVVEDPPHGGEVLADIEVCGDRRPSRRGSGNEPNEAIVELVRVSRRCGTQFEGLLVGRSKPGEVDSS